MVNLFIQDKSNIETGTINEFHGITRKNYDAKNIENIKLLGKTVILRHSLLPSNLIGMSNSSIFDYAIIEMLVRNH